MNRIFLTRMVIMGLIFLTTLIICIKKPLIVLFLCCLFSFLSLLFDKSGKLKERIKPLFVIGTTIILFQLIFNTRVGFSDRILQGLTAAAKIFTLSLLVFLFTMVISPNQITAALSFLPKKILFLLVVTFGMIPSIFTEAQKILIVQNARGRNSKTLNILKSFLPFIIPLLHRTLSRAEQIAISIQARGYDER